MAVKSLLLSLPIWLGLIFSYFFPFYGLKISSWAFYLLLLLGFINTINFDFHGVTAFSVFNKSLFDRLKTVLQMYLFWPAIQMLLASLLINDPFVLLGLLMASLAPIAIVVPQFLIDSEDKVKAIGNVLLSTILYPLFVFIYLKMFKFEQVLVDLKPLITDVIVLTVLPLLVYLIWSKFFIESKNRSAVFINKFSKYLNILIVGILVFIYFGSSFAKSNWVRVDEILVFKLIIMAFFQDFFIFFILKKLKFSSADIVSFSLKNVALSGGVLLVYQPQAVLACSIVFIAHAFMFAKLSKNPI